MQSCRLPVLLLPHADPAGAKPRRDHRFLDRVSRHVVPKTPGIDDAFKVYDPARVSHIPVSQSVRHPSGVAGSLTTPDPRVVGATPLVPGLKSGHPCRGASFTSLYNELNGFCTTQMRHPCDQISQNASEPSIKRHKTYEAKGVRSNDLVTSIKQMPTSITDIRFN